MKQTLDKKATVLFVCTGNSCRSQMAEGLLRHCGGERFEVLSAGTAPAGVNRRAVQVMEEVGIDISGQTSDLLNQEMVERADLLITLCGDARDTCPLVGGKVRKLHWPLDDPAGARGSEEEIMERFRAVRNSIFAYIKDLIREL